MRVLTDPVETGAVTLALPQDVQAEAFDWPVELFADRGPGTSPAAGRAAPDRRRRGGHPVGPAADGRGRRRGALLGAEQALRRSARRPASRSARPRPGKGSLPHGHPQELGAVGSTGTTAANAVAREADVVIGVGTRWSDFTTASRTAFPDEGVRFVNSTSPDSTPASTRVSRWWPTPGRRLTALTGALDDYPCRRGLPRRQARFGGRGTPRSRRRTTRPSGHRRARGRTADPGRGAGRVNELSDPRDVVLCAAGSMPGDLHKLWRVRDRKAYHVEYGYSCMGYEVARLPGIRLADDVRDVFAMVGDGGYLMMPTELVTAVQERIKVIVVLVQNHGFHSIGSLSESLGSQRFGTRYRYRSRAGRLDGDPLPVDLAANARSLGAHVIEVTRAPSSRRRSRMPRRPRPTAARSSSTSRPTRSSTRPTAGSGGTSRSARCPRSTRPARLPTPRVQTGAAPLGRTGRRGRTMSDRLLRVGMVGVGRMGADHAERIVTRIYGARLVAVADPDDRACWRPCGHASPGYAPSIDALVLIASDEVDAVLIASPGFVHEEQVFACLEAAKLVLCEKPLTLDWESSLRSW